MKSVKGSRGVRRWVAPIFVLAVLLALLVLLNRLGPEIVPLAIDRVRRLGALAPLGFLLLYALGPTFWVPGSLLTLAAGALFGLVWGTVYALVGATSGATLAFLVSRHLARSAVESRLGEAAWFPAVDEAIAREGAKIVFLLRLTPMVPFTPLNYMLGLTGVRLRDFVVASAAGMVPGTLLYAFTGHAAGEVAAALTGKPQGWWNYALLGLGLAATIVVTMVITRTARRALRTATTCREHPVAAAG